jgi:hypothetical protein
MSQQPTAAGAPPPPAPPNTVSRLLRTSAIVGAVDVEVARSEVDLLIEDCSDSTIFVTAALRSLTLRGLTRCTVIAAPATATVALAGCAECVVSAAAPSVVASDVVSSLLFVASRTPVSVGGASRDVRLGPYNVVGDGLLSNSGMREWTLKGGSGAAAGAAAAGGSSGGGGGGSGAAAATAVAAGAAAGAAAGSGAGSAGDTFCRLDSAAAACVRAITPADFFWRFLPVPQLRGERLPLPAAYATPDLPPDLARLDTRDTARSQKIEQLTQMKFVVRAAGACALGALSEAPQTPLPSPSRRAPALAHSLPYPAHSHIPFPLHPAELDAE